jgi:hypothetical protein
MLPGVLPVVDEHYAEMQRLEALAVLLVRRAWDKVVPTRIAGSWSEQVTRLLATFAGVQLLAAEEGAAYTAATLRAQGVRSSPDAAMVPGSLVGWASDGRPLETLLEAPARVAVGRLDTGSSMADAFEAGRVSVERIARTQIADTGRAAASIDIATRPGVAWVRMVSPPVCSRCLILAGRIYRWSDGFDRHPNCDCVHVATSVSAARREGLVDDPDGYFRRLSTKEQDRLLTKAGAQAVRDGADMNQVVNARRGMSTAGIDVAGRPAGRLVRQSVFGQEVFTTTEGTTTRGMAGQRLLAEGARLSGETAETVRRRSRAGEVSRQVTRQRVQIPRLMPEAIYELAQSRADAVRLLRRFGYIT